MHFALKVVIVVATVVLLLCTVVLLVSFYNYQAYTVPRKETADKVPKENIAKHGFSASRMEKLGNVDAIVIGAG